MQDSIFTKIIKGELPCYKIYEDSETFAFLDIYPIQPGQILVVPKRQIGSLWDLDLETYVAVMKTVHKVAKRLKECIPEMSRVAMHVEGLDVTDHAHVKVFPFNNDAEFRSIPDKSVDPDHSALAVMADKLRFGSNV